MKYTSIAMMIVGVVLLLGSAVASAFTTQPSQQAADVAVSRADLVFPIAIGIVALLIGVSMYLFGGRGVISTRNPAVRN